MLAIEGIARDITMRRQAEGALRESEERHRTILQTAMDGFWMTDTHGHLLEVNETYCRMSGYSERELLAMRIPDLEATETDDDTAAHFQRTIAQGEDRFESQHRRKDRSVFDVEVSVQYRPIEGGRLVVFLQDITHRKHAEEKLRESKQRTQKKLNTLLSSEGDIGKLDLADIIDTAAIQTMTDNFYTFTGVPVAIIDLQGRVFVATGWQDICTKFHRVHPETLRNCIECDTTLTKDISPGQFKSYLCKNNLWDNATPLLVDGRHIGNLFTGQFFYEGEKPNDEIFRSQAAQYGFDEQEYMAAVRRVPTWSRATIDTALLFYAQLANMISSLSFANIGLAKALAERKRTENELSAQKTLSEQLFMQSSVSTQILDCDGWCERINPKLGGLFGVAPENIEGKVYNIFKDEALKRGGIIPYLERVFYERKTAEWEVLFDIELAASSQGIEVEEYRSAWYRNWAFPILSEDGNVSHVVIQHLDITGQKQAEEALRQRLAELEAMHNVSTAMRTAQTRDEAMPILLDEMLAAMETDAGIIWLYDADNDELRAVGARGWFQSFALTPMQSGEGIAGTVFASGQVHVSAELARDPLLRQPVADLTPAGGGGICLPIRTGEVTMGAVTISVPLGHPVRPEQVRLLASLSDMGGATLHRMSLYEETNRHLDQLQALHHIDQAISVSTDLRVTLDILLEHVLTQLKVDAASVLLLNRHLQTLGYAAGRGFRTRAAESAHIRVGESFAGRAALERRAVHVGDPARIEDSPRFAALWAREGFAAYYAVPLIAKGQVVGVLEVFYRSPPHAPSERLDFLETLAGQAAIAIDSAQLFDRLQRSNLDLALAYDATIEGWSHALDLRDKETEGHTLRVTEMTIRLARIMGIGDAELVHVRRGALLHDIGKMGVPDGILLKPGPLNEEEWGIMRRHPQLAYDLLAPITYLRPALDIPYCHHERWDGTGYPRGLAGEQIPLAARLFAVIDVWDALRSDRPYREAWTEEKTLEHIRSAAGTHFDPKAVELFLDALNEE